MNKKNIISFPGVKKKLEELTNEPSFPGFLYCVKKSIGDSHNENLCIQWWENNEKQVYGDNLLIDLCQLLQDITLKEKTKVKETSKSVQTNVKQPPEFKEFEQREKLKHAELLEKYPIAAASFPPVRSICDSSYSTVFPVEHNPVEEVSNTFNLFVTGNTRYSSPPEKYTEYPSIYFDSDIHLFLFRILQWVSNQDSQRHEWYEVVEYCISGGERKYPKKKFLVEGVTRMSEEGEQPAYGVYGDTSIVKKAVASKLCVFDLFLYKFGFDTLSELLLVMSLPFGFKPIPEGPAVLHENNLDFIVDHNGYLEPGYPIKETPKNFYTDIREIAIKYFYNFSEFRKRYFHGQAFIDYTTQNEQAFFWFNIIDSYEDLRELGADLSFLISSYFCDYELYEFGVYDKSSDTYWYRRYCDAIKVITNALIDENLYVTATNFLSLSIYHITQNISDHEELSEDIFHLIIKVSQLPIKKNNNLELSVDHAIYKAKEGNHYIYAKKLDDLLVRKEEKLTDLIRKGESDVCEFKETLRKDLRTNSKNKELEKVVLKTICAFLNTKGGVLFIGVSDDGEIKGLKADQFKNNDAFLLHFSSLLDKFSEPVVDLLEYKIEKIKGEEVFIVECQPSRKPIFFEKKIYQRKGPSSNCLETEDALKYIQTHFDIN